MKFFLTAVGKFCCRTIRGLNSTVKKAKKQKKQTKRRVNLLCQLCHNRHKSDILSYFNCVTLAFWHAYKK